MTQGEYIAQIRILDYILNSLCNCEMNKCTREFIEVTKNKIKTNTTDDACNTEGIPEHS